jgi:hypothetical protein
MPTPNFKTCDLCRKRKVRWNCEQCQQCIQLYCCCWADRQTRCVPETDDADVPPDTCRTCSRAGVECTFLRGYRKPGRPRGAAASSPRKEEESSHAGPSRLPLEGRGQGGGPSTAGSNDTIAYPDFITNVTIPVEEEHRFTGANAAASGSSMFNPNESPSDAGLSSWNPIISPSTNPDPSPKYPTGAGATSLSEYRLAELTRLNSIPISRDMPLEDVGPWSAMSEILSVYLRYLHSLFPLVHKPSFAQSLAMRKDQTDRAFAATLLGLGELFCFSWEEPR